MNKGFKTYYKQARIKSKQVFKKKKNYTRYYSYLFSSLIGRILLILISPIFSICDFRLAKMVRADGDIIVSKAYEPLDSPKKIWNSVLAVIMTFIIFISGIIVIAIPTALMSFLGYLVCAVLQNNSLISTLMVAFAVPGALVMVCYIIAYPFYIAPTYYLMESVETASASGAIKNSFKIMRSHQKGCWTMFWLTFVPALLKVLYLSVAGVICYVLIFGFNSVMMSIAGYALGLLFILIFLAFAPKLTLTTMISNSYLFDDLFIFRPEGKGSGIRGLYAKNAKVKRAEVVNYKDNLVRLFDDTESALEVNKYRERVHPAPEAVEVKEDIIDIDKNPEALEEIINSSPVEEESVEEVVEENNQVVEENVQVEETSNENENLQEQLENENFDVETEEVVEEAKEEEVKEEKTLSKKELKAQEKALKKQQKEEAKASKKDQKEEKVEEPKEESFEENDEVQEEVQVEETEEVVSEEATEVVEDAHEEAPSFGVYDEEDSTEEVVQAEPAIEPQEEVKEEVEETPTLSAEELESLKAFEEEENVKEEVEEEVEEVVVEPQEEVQEEVFEKEEQEEEE